MASAKKPVLGYWNIRGLAEPIRTVLHYGRVDFEDRLYDFNTQAEDIKDIVESWYSEKLENPVFNEEFAFANLPYWIEGDIRLTQSMAILRHVARKAGLVLSSPSEKDQATLEMLEQQARDFRMNLICYALDNNMLKLRHPNYLETITDVLNPWSKYLGDKTWLMGDKLTYVDFLLFEGLDSHKLAKDDCLDAHLNLKKFHQRFKELPGVKAYHESDRYIQWPLYSPFAKVFGFNR